MKFLKICWREAYRVVLLLGLIVVLLWADSWAPLSSGRAELSPLFTSCALVLGFALVSHLTRRVLFPHLDLQRIAKQATETSLGAGLVFLGVCYVLSTLLSSNATLLR